MEFLAKLQFSVHYNKNKLNMNNIQDLGPNYADDGELLTKEDLLLF